MSYNFKAIAAEMAKADELAKAIVVDEKSALVVNKQDDEKEMSARAFNAVRRSIVSGILRSLSMHIFSKWPDPEVQNKKLETVVNAMLSSKDIDAHEASWLLKNYLTDLRCNTVASDPDCLEPCCSYAYLSWWMVMDNLLSDTHVYEWSFDYSDNGVGSLAPHEKALIENYKHARDEFYRTRSEFEKYFQEVNKKTLNATVTRYATVLQQVDPEWYKAIASSIGLQQSDTPECDCAEGC